MTWLDDLPRLLLEQTRPRTVGLMHAHGATYWPCAECGVWVCPMCLRGHRCRGQR